MSKRKVVFFAGRLIMGGVEMVLKNLLDELKERNDLELVVVANVKEKYFLNWFKENNDKIRLYNIRLRSSRKNGFFRKLLVFLTNTKLKSALAAADVIIDFKNGESWDAFKNFSGKKVVWLHGGFNWFLTWTDIRKILSFDRIICLTESFKKDFIATFPKHRSKITAIYNAVPCLEISEKAIGKAAPDGSYFLYAGRLNVDKDVSAIFLGFDKFWRGVGRPDVRLYVVGTGPKSTEIKNLANELDAREKIIFTGMVPEPFGYMRGALANILSSHQEGLPTVLIEAAACGTLNISSDCKSGPREILLDGSAGLLFPAGDSDALAKIMSDVYSDRIDRAEMIKNGTKGLVRFQPKKVAAQVEKVLF